MVSDSNEQIKEAFSTAAEETRKKTDAVAKRVKSKVRDITEQQKTVGADQIGDVREAVEAAADVLHGQMPMAAGYIKDVAKQLDTMASALRERSVDDMLGDVTDFARKQPALFFAGAVAAGFALSRFAKSSANRGS
jgi:hypothetical protein